MLEATTNCREFTPSDITEAGPDFLSLAMGARVARRHPVADQLRLREVKLAEVCHILGQRELSRRGATGKSVTQMITAGLASDDFGKVLEAAAGRVVSQGYDDAAEHRALVTPWPVQNYQPVTIATVDVDATTGVENEDGEMPMVRVNLEKGSTTELLAYVANLIASYQLIVNDDVEAFASTARAISVSAARREAQALGSFLEGNPTMGDGQPMFSSAAENLVSGISDVPDGITKVMAQLRVQKTPGGQHANHRLRTLLVHADDEQAARRFVRETALDVQVVALPWITSGTVYGQASTESAPTVALLYLGPRGDTSMRTIRVDRRPGDFIGRRTGVELAHDFNYAPISRIGICKATA